MHIKEKEHNTKYIYNSYNKGEIAGNQYIAGICGNSKCGTNLYYCVNTTDKISGTTIGSAFGFVYGSAYSYTNTNDCYYNDGNGKLKVIGEGKGSVSNSISFTGEIDKNFMLETLKKEISQVEWKGNSVDVWRINSSNDGYPTLYWE